MKNVCKDLLPNAVRIVFVRSFVAVALTCCGPVLSGGEEGSEVRFTKYLDARRLVAKAEGGQAYRVRPLTIECWARLDGRDWNILVAHEPKSSATHWELYTYRKTGELALYMPGYRPAEIRSGVDVVDGQWRYLAAVIEADRVRLYVDGQQVVEQAVTRPAELVTQAGPLSLGELSEGGIGCGGAIAEVRISQAARTINKIPAEPLTADASTIGLWRLDAREAGVTIADLSTMGNDARLRAATQTVQPTAPEQRDPTQRMLGSQVAVLAPPADADASRRLLAGALEELELRSVGDAAAFRDAVLKDWDEQYWHWENQIAGREPLPGNPDQAFDRHALCDPEDRDPLGVVLRRTAALLEHLQNMRRAPALDAWARDLTVLQAAAAATPPGQDSDKRKGLYLAGCALRRGLAFMNPHLDFQEILFVARGVPNGSRARGLQPTNDRQGQHFHTQYFAFNSIPGGGLFAVADFKTNPTVRNVVARSRVVNGRLANQKLEAGAFLSPELSFDGQEILFAWTENERLHSYEWNRHTTWNLFRVGVDGSDLTQLTDSPWNDFDPCLLPDGRIAFISERRGGYIRCFGGLRVPQHTLHSMAADGSDIRPLSWFVTGEWHPSVDNNGMIVYTRWDYVDRENCLGSNFWICAPDGRNPRAPHGNYPDPWHTFDDNTRGDSRIGRPYTEMSIRAVPGSRRYIATAAPHHGESFGSLVMIDLSVPDDGHMSQIKRITPYVRFPESEQPARLQYPYGTAWPFDESFYLVNWWENIYLLDRFGNRELLCENSLVFDGTTHWNMRLIDPIPIRPRPAPPIVPPGTAAGQPDGAPETARGSVMNVYHSDIPFPEGTRIRYLRVLQDIPKSNPQMNEPQAMGYHWENTPRIPLGIVPVEQDGSAHFEAPVERALIFQVLDENYMAVQTMRSVTHVQRGEHLACVGCHENPQTAPAASAQIPLAMLRPPSLLEPELDAVEPVNFYRLVEPVFQETCLPCHRQENAGPLDMSFEGLRPYVHYFGGGMRGEVMAPHYGGSRSIPGRVGARQSRMGRALLDATHRDRVPTDAYRRVVLWLDANALRLGAFYDEHRQMAGELVWPKLDVDPTNPQGLERLEVP